MTEIRIPIATGELLDKISILGIKSERIADPAKLLNIRKELAALDAVWQATGLEDEKTRQLTAELKTVNEALWEIEDDIRAQENRGEFGPAFVALARSVYRQNDQRAALKRAINEVTGSALIEEKSYQGY